MRCGINNIFKKPLATLMVLCMLAVTLTACGNDEATEISESVQTTATETTESEANDTDLKIDETVETTTEEALKNNSISLDMEKLRKEIGKIKGVGENRLNEIMAVIENNLSQ